MFLYFNKANGHTGVCARVLPWSFLVLVAHHRLTSEKSAIATKDIFVQVTVRWSVYHLVLIDFVCRLSPFSFMVHAFVPYNVLELSQFSSINYPF